MNESRAYKNKIYEEFGRIGKAVASPRRLELLERLSQRPHTVEDLATMVGQSLASTSHHLRLMHSARVVETEREGIFIRYRLADGVDKLLRAIRDVAANRLAEVTHARGEFARSHGSIPSMASADIDVRHRLQNGDILLLDVRPSEEFLSERIFPAISIPFTELSKRTAELPNDRDIAVCCRGPFCVLGVRAVSFLRKNGFSAFLIEDSVADWRAAGGETSTIRNEMSPQ